MNDNRLLNSDPYWSLLITT